MASTIALPGATNAAPTPPALTASHGNLPKPVPTAGSIPTKLPARFYATGIEKCVGGSCGEYVAITCQR